MNENALRVFLGYDARESIGFHVCVQSLMETCSMRFSIIPLCAMDHKDGTNAFTYERFMVPMLCNYEGIAVFADGSDMLFLDDLAKIAKHAVENDCAVSVVKREYKTRHSRKYVGTDMESDNGDYPRKNWSSLMVFNCAHPANKSLSRGYLDAMGGSIHRFPWLHDSIIGEIPERWNVLVGEDGDDEIDPAVLHYTLGIPAFKHYLLKKHSAVWFKAAMRVNGGVGS